MNNNKVDNDNGKTAWIFAILMIGLLVFAFLMVVWVASSYRHSPGEEVRFAQGQFYVPDPGCKHIEPDKTAPDWVRGTNPTNRLWAFVIITCVVIGLWYLASTYLIKPGTRWTAIVSVALLIPFTLLFILGADYTTILPILDKSDKIDFLVYPKPEWMGREADDVFGSYQFCNVTEFIFYRLIEIRVGDRITERWVELAYTHPSTKDNVVGYAWASLVWKHSRIKFDLAGNVTPAAQEWLDRHQRKQPHLE